MHEPILKVRHLTTKLQIKGKTVPVVNNLSFDIEKGKTLALVGESGSGKSMTALSLMRILPTPPALPPEGEVFWRGKNLLTLPERKMRKIRGKAISMIFQDPMSSLNPVYTVGEQLLEVAELHLDLWGEEAYERVILSLEEVGLRDPERCFEAYPHQLSGGMKQRVMIAMALMCEPDILIADEPTTALDVTIQKQVLDLIKELQKQKGMGLLLITHDMGVVAEMADDVIVLYATKTMEEGPVEEVLKYPAHPYTQGLIKSLPQLATSSRLEAVKGSVPTLTKIPNGCPYHLRCPYAWEKCEKGDVPLFEIQKEHGAHCWLLEKEQNGSAS